MLYIAGTGRSGSTVLELVLAEFPEVVGLGEVVNLWTKGVLANRLCGCGSPFHDCEFWSEIGRRAYGGWSEGLAREMAAKQRALRALPKTARLAVTTSLGASPRDLRAFQETIAAVYRAASDMNPGALLVDSSKDYRYALAMQANPEIAQRVIHLVRDSRGVAFSRLKRIEWPDSPDRARYMLTRAPLRMGVGWAGKNLLCRTLRPPVRPLLRLRYEDFVADPVVEIDRVARWLGTELSESLQRQLEGSAIELSTTHTVAGNPVRMSRGRLSLGLDDEWRRSMSRRDRAAVTAITWPLLLAYRYVPEQPVLRRASPRATRTR